MITKFQDFKKINEDNETIDVYMSDVKSNAIHIIKNFKKIPKFKSKEFIENLFSETNKNRQEIRDEIMNSFNNNQSAKNCARIIINNFYDGIKYTEQESESDTDVVEVNENNKLYYHYNNVSNSLFWNFMSRISNIGIKFNFDTTIISDGENSLNKKDYIFFIKTDDISRRDIEHYFIHSKLLSSILNVIKDDTFVNFFIGITPENKLKFGYYHDGDRYTIGQIEYKSNDIKRLSSYIKCSDSSLSFEKLSNRFKTNISIINFYKKILIDYLKTYVDLKIYLDIINDKISLIIETDDNGILNKKYINNIINSNNTYKLKSDDYTIIENINGNKTYYILNLK